MPAGPHCECSWKSCAVPAAAPAVAPAAVATTLWADAAYVLSAAEPAAPLVRPVPHAALRALLLLATQSPAGRWASSADVQWVLLGPLPAALGPPVSEPANRTSRPASCLLHGCDAEHRRGAGAAAPYLLVHPLPTRARVAHRCAAGESLPRCPRGRSVRAGLPLADPVKHLSPRGGLPHHKLMCRPRAEPPSLRVLYLGSPEAKEV